MSWATRRRHARAGGLAGAGASSDESALKVFVRPGHRDDIQGLRAVAVLLVAFGHAGVEFLRGGFVGVDVFFVLSGFLITQLLLSEAVESGSVSLVNFYVRRARRILPAAALTLVATDIAAYFLLNFVRAREAISDSVWAALFGANIRFARRATDYFAQGRPPSTVLHYWSLSVEEQFYFVWPSLLALALFATLLGRRLRGSSRPVTPSSLRRLFLLALAATVTSFIWSLHATAASPASTYYSPFARAWELGLGATLAIATPLLLRVPHVVHRAAGWIGLVLIAVAAVTLSGATPFPGAAALLPTTGAALVIGSGIAGQPRRGVGRLLSPAPMRYVGDRSYTFYLWHWPFLALAADYVSHPLSVGTRLLLICAAFLLSSVTFRVYEDPLRRMKWRRPAGVLLWPASAAVVAVAAFACTAAINSSVGSRPAAAAVPQPAVVLNADAAGSTPPALPSVIAAVKAAQRGAKLPSPLVPPIGQLESDIYSYPDSACVAHSGQRTHKICYINGANALVPAPGGTTTTASSTGSSSTTRTLVVFGDSHAEMWMPDILAMAQQDGWLVVPLDKSGCTALYTFTPTGPSNEASIRAECRAWFAWAVGQAKALHPDAALIGISYSGLSGKWATNAINGITGLEAKLKTTSKHVVVTGDVPDLSKLPEPVDCLLEHGATMKTCTGTWTQTDLSITHALAALATLHGVSMIDTTGWLCYNSRCPMVVGHTIVYRDYGHITQTYAKELTPTFRASFLHALGR